MTWHSRLQNHTLRQRPHRSSLQPLLPQVWHEVAAAIVEVRGGLWLGPAAAGKPDASSASASVCVAASSAGRQLAPE